MKTFLNVLYRRILYKIPLKLLLILLAVFGLLFAVSNATEITNITTEGTYTVSTSTSYDINMIWLGDYSVVGCLSCSNINTNGQIQDFSKRTIRFSIVDQGCFYLSPNAYVYLDGQSQRSCTLTITNPNYTSQQCQTEYNLIPINEIDNAYCESNNLCSSSSSPSDCPNVGVSNLFINDIFHPGAFNIIMNIPEEISRDYAYTNSGYNFNLDIEGYNVDYEKMQSVIDNQSYIPTEEDFQNIIAILTPYTKIIVFFVFLFIVWAWIKKPFKSKKL